FEHHRGLICIPSLLASQRRSAQRIQETVHLCLNFLSILSQRMVETSCKLDRQLMRSRGYERFGNLHRTWKCICSHSAGAQFVAEGRQVGIRVKFGEQRDSLLRSIGRGFPENRQIAENRSRFRQRREVDVVWQKHIKVTN